MESYVSLNKFNSTGNLFLSKKVFISLGLYALDSIKEVIKRTNKQGIKLNDEVNVMIKNNSVYYRFNVDINYDVNEEYVKNSIQDIVTTDLLIMCDVVPINIETKIRKINK